MIDIIKPVRYGILIGLLGLTFGIGWAFYLVLGHERIHKSLEERTVQGIYQQGRVEQSHQYDEESSPQPKEGGHTHMMGEGHQDMANMGHQHGAEEEPREHFEGQHDTAIMELAHTRLRRGHVHAMGLGLVTIAVSFIMAFTSAPERIKTIAPVLAGIGGIIYPFAWIVMGYRTPGIGPAGAEASVAIIAGPGVALVVLGIFTAGAFLLKDVFQK